MLQNKTDSTAGAINIKKNNSKRLSKLDEKLRNTEKNSFNVLNWTNDLKNREDLTEREYVHIGQDLRQSLIGY